MFEKYAIDGAMCAVRGLIVTFIAIFTVGNRMLLFWNLFTILTRLMSPFYLSNWIWEYLLYISCSFRPPSTTSFHRLLSFALKVQPHCPLIAINAIAFRGQEKPFALHAECCCFVPRCCFRAHFIVTIKTVVTPEARARTRTCTI